MAFLDTLMERRRNAQMLRKTNDFRALSDLDNRKGEQALKGIAKLSAQELQLLVNLDGGVIRSACRYVAAHPVTLEAPVVRKALQKIEAYAETLCDLPGDTILLSDGGAIGNFQVANILAAETGSPHWQAEQRHHALDAVMSASHVGSLSSAILEAARTELKEDFARYMAYSILLHRIEAELRSRAEEESGLAQGFEGVKQRIQESLDAGRAVSGEPQREMFRAGI
jgi:hypothetical protein